MIPEGVDGANVLKYDFIDADHVWWTQLDGPQSLGSIGPPQWSGWDSCSNFGTEFSHFRPPLPNQSLFSSQTRWQHFLYDTKSSWILKSKYGEVWFPTFLAPLSLIFSKGNRPKWSIWPTTGSFCLIFIAIIFFIEMLTIHIKMTQIRSVGGEIWENGGKT
jgi:hypothetical protein